MPSAVDGGMHQSIARIDLLLSALSTDPSAGMKLADVCKATGLGKATAHRLLSGLVAYRLADFDPASGRYLIGFKIFSWASGVGNRYGLIDLARPGMVRLIEQFQDAVYLIVRSGDDAVCVERLEGSFPIKTLILQVGGRRPLGVGAGSAAILAALPPAEQEAVLVRNADARRAYPCSDADIRQILASAARDGYSVVDGKIVPQICTVGAAIRLDDGSPVAAISMSAITERMDRVRRAEIAAAILAEIRAMRDKNSALFKAANRSRLLAGRIG